MRRVLVTGSAGFIGFHLARRLLARGDRVFGYDAITDYYDVTLKRRRHAILAENAAFTAREARLEDRAALAAAFDEARPGIVIHLAAQAGVRYSLENPRAYVESNVEGSFNLLEAAQAVGAGHLLMASTSSVYGANEVMPFTEDQKADSQLTIYAATKKAGESMAHAWAHLHALPTTMFRFFTVYGPWGRPDMAFFSFTRAILEGRPIDIYNHGRMLRDFTYVDDIVRAIEALAEAVPGGPETAVEGDSLSPAAPFRIVNIGNGAPVRLLDFIAAIEDATGRRAIRNYMDMQPGDVAATHADTTLLHRLTGFTPATDYREGVRRFVTWYRDYYGR